QQVQISAHPRAYDKWENMAKELVSVLSGSSTGSKGTSIENEGCSRQDECLIEGSSSPLAPGEAADPDQIPKEGDPEQTIHTPSVDTPDTKIWLDHLQPVTQH